jgi:Glycosyltransferase family 87
LFGAGRVRLKSDPCNRYPENSILQRNMQCFADLVNRIQGWKWTLPALVLLIVLTTLTWIRIEKRYSQPTGRFDLANNGHSDFHNGLYLPTRAFAAGENPWLPETASKYLASRAAPSYSPSLFILNAVFALADLPLADYIWFAFNVGLAVALAWIGVRFSGGRANWALVLWLTILLMISRPGHITLFTGYFTLQLVLGYAMALHFARSSPAVSAFGMLLASAKPNFVLPLIILMTARRDWRAVMLGVCLCGVFAVGGILWLARDSSVSEVLDGYRQGQEALRNDPTELPENRWTRVDLVGMYARVMKIAPGDAVYLGLMPVILAIPALVLFRKCRKPPLFGAVGTSGMLIAVASLLSIHHHSYDCLLLFVPWAGFMLFGPKVAPELGEQARMAVTALVSMPAVNYLSTITFRDKSGLDPEGGLFVAITLLNGVCLLAAMLVLIIGWRRETPNQDFQESADS